MDRNFVNKYCDLTCAEDVLSHSSNFIKFCDDTYQLSDDLLNRLEIQVKSRFDLISSKLSGSSDQELSVYVGSAGLVMLCVALHKNKADNNTDLSYLKHCLPVCRRLSAVPLLTSGSSSRRQASLVCGAVGGWTLSAVVFNLLQQQQQQQDYQKKINCCLEKISAVLPLIENNTELPSELLYGRVGYLAALLYLKQQCVAMEDIDLLIDKTVRAVLREGLRGARGYSKTPSALLSPPLMYTWHGKYYLGAAHGVAGILTVLLQAVSYIDTHDLNHLIRPTIDYLASLQLPSGNFPSSLESAAKDRLVQWCHGAAGFSHLFSMAYQVFSEDCYLQLARDCCDVVWRRGLLRKGHSLCHGTAGNAYAFLHLYQLTKDVTLLYRACCFADWCLESRDCPPADRPFSLFEGEAGTCYLLEDIQRPLQAKFPAFIF